jgi:hypothetical protein
MDPEPVTFTLANETFTLNTGIADEVRREAHYKDGSVPLTADEQRILTTLGIDETMESTLRPYMPEFFKALPGCHTDASLRLSKACEVPYYVIWSTTFANRENTKARIAQNKKDHKSRNLLTMAQDGALIDEMHPKNADKDLYTALFTLIPAKGPAPGPVSARGFLNPATPISGAPGGPPTDPGPKPAAPGPNPSAPPASPQASNSSKTYALQTLGKKGPVGRLSRNKSPTPGVYTQIFTLIPRA